MPRPCYIDHTLAVERAVSRPIRANRARGCAHLDIGKRAPPCGSDGSGMATTAHSVCTASSGPGIFSVWLIPIERLTFLAPAATRSSRTARLRVATLTSASVARAVAAASRPALSAAAASSRLTAAVASARDSCSRARRSSRLSMYATFFCWESSRARTWTCESPGRGV